MVVDVPARLCELDCDREELWLDDREDDREELWLEDLDPVLVEERAEL